MGQNLFPAVSGESVNQGNLLVNPGGISLINNGTGLYLEDNNQRSFSIDTITGLYQTRFDDIGYYNQADS
jgi:hypothetical protein